MRPATADVPNDRARRPCWRRTPLTITRGSRPPRDWVELVEVQPEGKGRGSTRGPGRTAPTSPRPIGWVDDRQLPDVAPRVAPAAGRASPAPPGTPPARSRWTRWCASKQDGGYANLVLANALADTALDARDRALVTELVYGTTRMRRACDWLVDRFLLDDLEPRVRSALRMGAYQLTYLRVPAHAAVSATVDVVPARARGLANAVLRRVSDNPVDPDAAPEVGGWPDLATRLSYPDWIVDRLTSRPRRRLRHRRPARP